MARYRWLATRAALLGCVMLLAGFGDAPTSGRVQDEARSAGRAPKSFPMATEDYFHDMDGGVALTPDEVKGRNMWLVWTGGNDRFWDGMTAYTFGAFDLLKIVTSHPSQQLIDRDTRWSYLGADQRALLRHADRARSEALRPAGSTCAARIARPIRSRTRRKYPGVQIGARGNDGHAGRLLLRLCRPASSGLRLFPNPDFDEAAATAWDAERYFTDPTTTTIPTWCGPIASACPAASAMSARARSIRRPIPANPQLADLSSTVGAQYHVGRPPVHLSAPTPKQLHVPARAHLSAGRDGHLAGLDRQHQQPAHDECGLRPRRAARTWRGAGARRRWQAASSTTSSSTTSSPAVR